MQVTCKIHDRSASNRHFRSILARLYKINNHNHMCSMKLSQLSHAKCQNRPSIIGIGLNYI
jgi:hypothetical protein